MEMHQQHRSATAPTQQPWRQVAMLRRKPRSGSPGAWQMFQSRGAILTYQGTSHSCRRELRRFSRAQR